MHDLIPKRHGYTVVLCAQIALAALFVCRDAIAASAATELYWGDTHVHTSYSLDANLFNNFTLGPDVAYRFAKGEEVVTDLGAHARLDRPLDFLVVADHAEFMGVFRLIRENHPAVAETSAGQKVRKFIQENPTFVGIEKILEFLPLLENDPLIEDEGVQRIVWDDIIAMAEVANEPGRFTALVGYEWSSMPGGNNLHRNVVFRDGPDKTQQVLPFSAIHSDRPEDLWAYLRSYERDTGGQAIAIAHNPNLSNGTMFAVEDSEGNPIDAPYARLRSRYEPLVEVTQIKGDSETHPFLSPDDEFADHDRWDKTNLAGSARTEESMLVGNYARSALMNGLLVRSRIGANPFQFGLIGSTDSHTSLATADENNYWGKTATMPPDTNRVTGVFTQSTDPTAESTYEWQQAAAGYAGVWATENTRPAIFDALRRREVYATTGPRIRIRFFGGWDFEPKDASSHDVASAGYAKGVPMGAELSARPKRGAVPAFLLAVSKDPESGNLERVQVVKGWLDGEGQVHEKVMDARVAADVAAGESQMTLVFQDPDFDPDALAFYYARAIEVPTLRWNAYDAARIGTPLSGAPATHRERAYTSPIWYTPTSDR